jgi:hypothetical protein
VTTRRIVTLMFDVSQSKDAELTCIVCQRNLLPCDLSLTIYRNGETALAGLHQECAHVHMRRRERVRERSRCIRCGDDGKPCMMCGACDEPLRPCDPKTGDPIEDDVQDNR